MVNLGKFLMELYTGHQTHEKEIKYQNLTDAYLDLNYDPKKKSYTVGLEPYLGITKKYLKGLKHFLAGEIVSSPDLISFDKLLNGSFYEFKKRKTI